MGGEIGFHCVVAGSYLLTYLLTFIFIFILDAAKEILPLPLLHLGEFFTQHSLSVLALTLVLYCTVLVLCQLKYDDDANMSGQLLVVCGQGINII